MARPDGPGSREPSPAVSAASGFDPSRELVEKLTGSLNFVLSFYEPGQSYLDTNAWAQAHASAVRAFNAGNAHLGSPWRDWESRNGESAHPAKARGEL